MVLKILGGIGVIMAMAVLSGCSTFLSCESKPQGVVIEKTILENSPCYQAKRTIEVKGLMLHSVGCPMPSAMVFVRDWNRKDYNRACVHAFIDAHSGVVYQTLPWNHRGWHAGSGEKGSANNTHIGVEMCEPEFLKYGQTFLFTCSDLEASREMARRTYRSAVHLFAYLCYEFKLNPLEDGVIISHAEGKQRQIASNHNDPEHLWTQLNLNLTMDTFRQDVAEALKTYRP